MTDILEQLVYDPEKAVWEKNQHIDPFAKLPNSVWSLYELAIRYQKLDLLKEMYHHAPEKFDPTFENNYCLRESVNSGCYEIFEWFTTTFRDSLNLEENIEGYLQDAVRVGSLRLVKYILFDLAKEYSAKYMKMVINSAFELSVEHEQTEISKWLVTDSGIDIDLQDVENLTIRIVSEIGNYELLEWILLSSEDERKKAGERFGFEPKDPTIDLRNFFPEPRKFEINQRCSALISKVRELQQYLGISDWRTGFLDQPTKKAYKL